MQEDLSRPLPRRDFLKLLGPGLYILASAAALSDAAGVRIRRLPLTPERVRAALA